MQASKHDNKMSGSITSIPIIIVLCYQKNMWDQQLTSYEIKRGPQQPIWYFPPCQTLHKNPISTFSVSYIDIQKHRKQLLEQLPITITQVHRNWERHKILLTPVIPPTIQTNIFNSAYRFNPILTSGSLFDIPYAGGIIFNRYHNKYA